MRALCPTRLSPGKISQDGQRKKNARVRDCRYPPNGPSKIQAEYCLKSTRIPYNTTITTPENPHRKLDSIQVSPKSEQAVPPAKRTRSLSGILRCWPTAHATEKTRSLSTPPGAHQPPRPQKKIEPSRVSHSGAGQSPRPHRKLDASHVSPRS